MLAKVMTAKVGSALFREAAIHLISGHQAEKCIEESSAKVIPKPNRSFSRKMALIQAV